MICRDVSTHRPLGSGFDRLARHYYWMECVLAGRTLQKCRTAFLEQTRNSNAALLIGEGNGRFLAEFLKVNKTATVVCIDSSSRMLQLARQRVCPGNRERVHFLQADLCGNSTDCLQNQFTPGAFDLVVTHFFLDCFPPAQLEAIIEKIIGFTAPHATWLLADFRVPESGLARTRAKAILWLAYTFFRIVTRLPAKRITPPDSFLEQHGFALEKRMICEHGLLHSDLWRVPAGVSRKTDLISQVQTAERISSLSSSIIESASFGRSGKRLL